MAQRTPRRRSTRRIKRVEGSRERTDIIGAGTCDIAHDINPHAANARERDVCLDFPELRSRRCLQQSLRLLQAVSGKRYATSLRQRHPASPIYDAFQALRDSDPESENQSVAWPVVVS